MNNRTIRGVRCVRHVTQTKGKIMKLKKLVAALAVLGITAIAAPAAIAADMAAGDAGWYAGLSAGRADYKDGCDTSGTGFVGSCDDDDTGWKLYGGYQFTKNWGLEFGWVDFGEISAKGTILGIPATAKAEVDGWTLSGVGTLPFADNFSGFAKLGIIRAKVDMKGTIGGVSGSADDTSTEWAAGLGVKYDFTNNVSLRAEWERFNDLGDLESDIDLLSIGVVFKF